MEINTLNKLEKKALKKSGMDFIRLGFALFFAIGVLAYSFLSNGGIPNNMFLAVAALIGAYMAMNIGANDVANNVGPAVGSRAMSMTMAVIVAAIFEASGAFIAGGDVVQTIKKGIIDIDAFGGNPDPFIWAMMAALLAAAVWLNIATALKAPVSTTHSIVGGVMGAGIAAAGVSIVSWTTMGAITASWIISPLLGGAIAAAFLYAIKRTILFQKDMVHAAKKYVPVYVALMGWAFTTYLVLKGLKKIWPSIVELLNTLPFITLEMSKKPSFLTALLIGAIVGVVLFVILKATLKNKQIEASTKGVNTLFTIPLVFAAALLSFAHGANDVANAVGPLAAISDAITNGGISSKASIPMWVMAVGGLGIAIGLMLYGPKLIKTVGGEITELNQMRAFSIAMAAAITVIIASQLGLPVSSTHIAIGGVFGVGFLREYLDATSIEQKIARERELLEEERSILHAYEAELAKLEQKEHKTNEDYERIVTLYKKIEHEEKELEHTKKHLKKVEKQKYVHRESAKKIAAAWIITVPAAAVLAGILFYAIRGIML